MQSELTSCVTPLWNLTGNVQKIYRCFHVAEELNLFHLSYGTVDWLNVEQLDPEF